MMKYPQPRITESTFTTNREALKEKFCVTAKTVQLWWTKGRMISSATHMTLSRSSLSLEAEYGPFVPYILVEV